jgi:hypothetical protein
MSQHFGLRKAQDRSAEFAWVFMQVQDSARHRCLPHASLSGGWRLEDEDSIVWHARVQARPERQGAQAQQCMPNACTSLSIATGFLPFLRYWCLQTSN